MSNMIRLSIPTTGAAMLAAPRHVWLATLGAAAVTREWAEKEAAPIFRTLVKEGSVVESRALRVVGNRVETSMTHANALVRDARSSVRATVESLASIASSFVRSKSPTVTRTGGCRSHGRAAQARGEAGEGRQSRNEEARHVDAPRRETAHAKVTSIHGPLPSRSSELPDRQGVRGADTLATP